MLHTMRLHRFFVAQTISASQNNTVSDQSLAHQLMRVFRLHSGDKAIFFDGLGFEYESEIVSLNRDHVSFHVIEKRLIKLFSDRKVSVVLSLIKKDNFEWAIQKCTELGVSEFIPVISERSEKKGFNTERAKKIAIEACEQSGRGVIPIIHEPMSFKYFLEKEKRTMIAFHTSGKNFDPKNVSDKKDIVVCIGPEGGWSDIEIEAFKKKGAEILEIHAPILRAETAAIAVAALFLLL